MLFSEIRAVKCSSVLLEKGKLISFSLRIRTQLSLIGGVNVCLFSFFLWRRTRLFLIGCVNVRLFSMTKRKLLETTAHLFSKSKHLSDRKWRAL